MVSNKTYNADIPQCRPALSAAASNSVTPISAMVGAIVRGPMNWSKNPTIPVKPMTTWRQDAVIMAPWICMEKTVLNGFRHVPVTNV